MHILMACLFSTGVSQRRAIPALIVLGPKVDFRPTVPLPAADVTKGCWDSTPKVQLKKFTQLCELSGRGRGRERGGRGESGGRSATFQAGQTLTTFPDDFPGHLRASDPCRAIVQALQSLRRKLQGILKSEVTYFSPRDIFYYYFRFLFFLLFSYYFLLSGFRYNLFLFLFTTLLGFLFLSLHFSFISGPDSLFFFVAFLFYFKEETTFFFFVLFCLLVKLI